MTWRVGGGVGRGDADVDRWALRVPHRIVAVWGVGVTPWARAAMTGLPLGGVGLGGVFCHFRWNFHWFCLFHGLLREV